MWLTFAEAAEKVGVHRKTVNRWRQDGCLGKHLKARYWRDRYWTRTEWLEEFVKSRQEDPYGARYERLRRKPEKKRNVYISLRVSPGERMLINDAAWRAGVDRSTWMRDTLLEAT